MSKRKRFKRKLKIQQVLDIRRRHAAGGVTYDQLAKLYDVSAGQIGAIVRGEQWGPNVTAQRVKAKAQHPRIAMPKEPCTTKKQATPSRQRGRRVTASSQQPAGQWYDGSLPPWDESL